MATNELQPPRRSRPGPWPSAPASSVESNAPRQPLSWARRTGFRPMASGDSTPSTSGQIALPRPREAENHPDLDARRPTNTPIPPPLPATSTAERINRDRGDPPAQMDQAGRNAREANGGVRTAGSVPTLTGQMSHATPNGPARPVPVQATTPNGHVGPLPPPNGSLGSGPPNPPPPPPIRPRRDEEAVTLPQVMDDDEVETRATHMNYELRDTPGLVPIILYAVQHYLSMMGSLILMPLIIVPAMGGTKEETSEVVSTVLFISGVTTLLHTFFGSRLPLVQGPSFVFLAPALAIINSRDFESLNGNNFKHIMKQLQGSLIISSAFQAILGYSGIMSLLIRLITPVVTSATITAVGLSFFSYGFTQVGTCLEIGFVQIMLVIIFALYLRKIRVFGHRVFLVYTVPLGLGITWALAFLLTESGAYSYKGCDINIPASNIISDYCRKHISRMKHCRVDTSHALRSSPWFRFPYPLQWGTPVFNWKFAIVMCSVAIIASVDSVGTYHASSVFATTRAPTPGVLSRGITIEGVSSILAGLWGTGVGSTTLTENIHTIGITKMASRRAVEVGAGIMILLSLVGKVGGFIASIPEVIVAGLLCFMWAMLAAIGLSTLRYSEAGSSRNNIIVGLSLFFSLSVPAYFQQYGISPSANSSVPSYFQPYIVASHGPFHTGYGGVNYILNTVLSLNMVIAFLVAVVLDNTVPGTRQERGMYSWSEKEDARREPSFSRDYELPFRVGRAFRWVRWVGL
ncbi:nucleobase-ascorbate transporter 12 [Dioscorea cayenensis subsp. rotundata]|uniref:Nucleobase-ascorbate transporter 12 n=1 Tax=Dioscorea cayennensis subsp. rotundata TaxID=55577 RepID=A0AB40B018_DIOCR|nr:nucleobase-ascorbate transporter 12 [Dioscorea cayenensis subsp. rotundata]XP_039120059.1 nucleobase-ascorbate transporter 12 [Dioscorea cayenensis subsp. rotundata]